MKKLAIISTHPIQYYSPLYALLSKQKLFKVKVFYTWEKDAAKFDRDFGKVVEWDIPLLDGYDYCYVSNENNYGRNFWDVKNPGLNREIENWGATAVLVIGWNYKSHLKAMMHFKNRIPVLFKGDSTLLDEDKNVRTFLRRLFLKFIYKFVDYALFVGTANKQYFLRHGLKEKQLKFAPHAIDNDRFGQVNKEQQDFIKNTKELLCIGTECTTIVYCGKLQTKKNPQLLIRAVKNIDYKNLHLIIIGSGELEAVIKNEIMGFERIHLMPFQNQTLMPAIYRLGEIFCLPSSGPGETWGLGVNEAMVCGRTILVSDKAGCATDLVKDGINGYRFISDSIEDLQEKLKLLLSDKERLVQMSNASSEMIKDWNYEAIAETINKLVAN